MKEFADELRAFREAKHISLTDISSATKIQLKYLRAIEESNFLFLPQIYVRAFVRDYAKALQLDPDETLRRYDSFLEATERGAGVAESRQAAIQLSPHSEKDSSTPQTGISKSIWLSFRNLLTKNAQQQKYLPVAAVLLLVLVIVLIANLTRNAKKESVQETPFEQIVKEKERTQNGQSDSTLAALQGTTASLALSDSLTLEAAIARQVWMRLFIDDRKPEEYLFSPNVQRAWKAHEKFLVTLGDAGGVTFKLNGKDLGMLGKSGAVVRNALITRDGLHK